VARVAFIGVGRMAQGLIESFKRKGGIEDCEIVGTHYDPTRCDTLHRVLQIPMLSSNRDAVRDARYVILCVRPLQLLSVAEEIGDLIGPDQTVISIAVGVPVGKIRQRCPESGPIFHVHPPSLCMAQTPGMSFVANEPTATEDDIRRVEEIFRKLGFVMLVHEEDIDRFAVFAGASPAFICQILHEWRGLAREAGIEKGITDEIVHYMVRGIHIAFDGDDDIKERQHFSLEEIIDRIATPNGVTRVGLGVMKKRNIHNFRGALKGVAEQCLQKIGKIRQAVSRQ